MQRAGVANSWGGGSAAYDLNGNGSVLDDPRELYTYDEQWRVVANHRQGPANQLEVNAPRPPAQLYQRFVYHQDGLPAQGISTGVIDRVVLRQGLKDAGFTRPVGGRTGSTEAWMEHFANSPGSQQRAFEAVRRASEHVDRKYPGTNATEYFWLNIQHQHYYPAP
ncbi:MAG: hypothetical protein ACK55O_00330, partial [Phycisphaerales bacterium]